MQSALSRAPLLSERTTRILTHLHQARLGRSAMVELGLSFRTIAERAKVGESTVRRFLHFAGRHNTVDPKTQTTRKIFEVLGYELELRRVR